MSALNEPGRVREQYATEDNLQTRLSVWHPTIDGRDPATVALDEIRDLRPGRVLEVGCGTGAFAARLLDALPGVDLVAIDQSERFVELTAARRVTAQLADVQALPFEDGSFDLVAAMWMLYHVPDLHRGLAEIRRVLRPGGTFVAATNGDEHVAELRRAVGRPSAVTQFSSQNGEAVLRAHFTDVHREDLVPRAIFPDHSAAVAYLASSHEADERELPWFDGPREYAGQVTVFVAR